MGKYKCLLDIFLQADILGPSYGITMGKEGSLKTVFGASLSSIFVIFFSFSSFTAIQSLFDTTNPSITPSTEAFDKRSRIEIGHNYMLPVFYVNSTAEGRYLSGEEIRKKFAVVVQYYFYDASQTDPVLNKGMEQFTGEPCKEMKLREGAHYYPAYAKNYEESKNDIEGDGYCLNVDPEHIYNEGYRTDNKYRYIEVEIVACYAYADCETSSTDYSKYVIEISHPTVRVNFSDRDSPVALHVDPYDVVETSHFNIERIDSMTVIPNTISNDHWYLNQQTLVKEYFSLEGGQKDFALRRKFNSDGTPNFNCTKDRLDVDDCEIFYRMEYTPSSHQYNYLRGYPKVLDTLGNIGGSSTTLLQLFIYMNAVYLLFYRTRLMVKRIFPIFYSKKSSKIPEIENHRKAAVDFIDNYFDIQNIMNELAQARVLVKVLLDPVQMNLVSISVLSDYTKKMTRFEELKKEKKGNNSKVEPMNVSESSSPMNKQSRLSKQSDMRIKSTYNREEEEIESYLIEDDDDIDYQKRQVGSYKLIRSRYNQMKVLYDKEGGGNVEMEALGERVTGHACTPDSTVDNIRYQVDGYMSEVLKNTALDVESVDDVLKEEGHRLIAIINEDRGMKMGGSNKEQESRSDVLREAGNKNIDNWDIPDNKDDDKKGI